MSGFYRFPAMANLEELSSADQADKVHEESLEVCSAQWMLESGKLSMRPDLSERRTAYGMELIDVIHAAETALRMEFSENEVDNLKIATIVKNIKRGYYEWDDR